MADDDDEEEEVDLEDQTRRTERLRAVLPTLAHLWYSGSEQMDVATEKLADRSRDRKLSHILRIWFGNKHWTFLSSDQSPNHK